MDKFSKINVVQLATYTSPEVTEERNKEWVNLTTQEGEDYFSYLIDRFNGSATNNAIITAISKMIYGRGLGATNSSKQIEAWTWLSTSIKKDTLQRIAHDLKLFNKFALQVIWSKDGKKITQVAHFPVDKLRAEKCNDEGDIEAYYYS